MNAALSGWFAQEKKDTRLLVNKEILTVKH
jgi:hypothetical protein